MRKLQKSSKKETTQRISPLVQTGLLTKLYIYFRTAWGGSLYKPHNGSDRLLKTKVQLVWFKTKRSQRRATTTKKRRKVTRCQICTTMLQERSSCFIKSFYSNARQCKTIGHIQGFGSWGCICCIHDDASALLLLQILVHGNGCPSLTQARTTYMELKASSMYTKLKSKR